MISAHDPLTEPRGTALPYWLGERRLDVEARHLYQMMKMEYLNGRCSEPPHPLHESPLGSGVPDDNQTHELRSRECDEVCMESSTEGKGD